MSDSYKPVCLSAQDKVEVLVVLAIAAAAAKEIAAFPMPEPLRHINSMMVGVFLGATVMSVSLEYGVPKKTVAAMLAQLLTQKTEVEKPEPHEGPEGPTQS